MVARLSLFLFCALITAAQMARGQGSEPQPPWRSRLMPWRTHAGQARPWRTDPRLAGSFEPGYPDDVLVIFGNPDSLHGLKPEGMWVTITAFDSVSGLFLGILINQPYARMGVDEGDNVVFRIHPDLKRPVAVAFNGSYNEAGWPPSAAPQFFARRPRTSSVLPGTWRLTIIRFYKHVLLRLMPRYARLICS